MRAGCPTLEHSAMITKTELSEDLNSEVALAEGCLQVLRALPDAHAVALFCAIETLFSAMPSIQSNHAVALPQDILSK